MKRIEYLKVTPNNAGKSWAEIIVRSRKTHRNDPCPCGAKDEEGKSIKFKKCCLEAKA